MENLSYALEVSPETALQFQLSRGDGSDSKNPDGTARCVMTLTHTGQTKSHLAFKVKTTQPRRYLVRPNQGIVAPGTAETVTIILVEKDKQMLLQSFDRLGQSALDHSKDKFLVQSCAVPEDFAAGYMTEKAQMIEIPEHSPEAAKIVKELAESLTGMWNEASSGDETPILNKKLQVRHVAAPPSPEDGKVATPKSRSLPDKANLENMTQEQMFMEISSLRRKYDELVTFSVNLTAERDILNNALEQTKRDLTREMARSKRDGNEKVKGETIVKQSSGGLSFFTLLLMSVLFFLIGVKATKMDVLDVLFDVPVLGDFMNGEL